MTVAEKRRLEELMTANNAMAEQVKQRDEKIRDLMAEIYRLKRRVKDDEMQ